MNSLNETQDLSSSQRDLLQILQEQALQQQMDIADVDETNRLETLEKNTCRTRFLAKFFQRQSKRKQQKIQKKRQSLAIIFRQHLVDYEERCDTVLKDAELAMELLDSIEDKHQSVYTKTNDLHDSCETLLRELEELNLRLVSIEKPMPYFQDLESLSRKLGYEIQFSRNTIDIAQNTMHRHIDPCAKECEDYLKRVDECIMYLQEHPEYKDAEMFANGYRLLMSRSLAAVQEKVIRQLESAKDAVLTELSQRDSSVNSTEIDETSPYYVAFRTIVISAEAVTNQLQPRRAYQEYDTMLTNIYETYVQQRVYVLTPSIAAYFAAFGDDADLMGVIRLGCSYMIRLCRMEHQLFVKLFGSAAVAAPFLECIEEEHDSTDKFQSLVFELSASLYNAVRPRLISQDNMEVLCELVQVLRAEMIEEQIQTYAQEASAVQPVLDRIIEDAQERLIFCSQVYIRDYIQAFEPSADDLDYPAKLEADTTGHMYAAWYPTLESTLLCLSKIYRFVNVKIFEAIAQDAIHVCTASLKMAAADITAAKGEVDGKLFLIKNLLSLREQITPFDIQFSVEESHLDFSSTTDALSHLLSDAAGLFSLSSENTLLGLITRGIPSVHKTETNAKSNLERELKVSCTSFMEMVIKASFSPILSFLNKVSAFQELQKDVGIQTQPFAQPPELKKVLNEVELALTSAIPQIQAKMHLYLASSETEKILFNPVKENGFAAFMKLEEVIQKNYDSSISLELVDQLENMRQVVKNLT